MHARQRQYFSALVFSLIEDGRTQDLCNAEDNCHRRNTCPSSKPNPPEFPGAFNLLAITSPFMATPTSGAVPAARSELRTRTALVLEAIAPRHQIAVLECSRTRRPCLRRLDGLLWILLSRWWPQWRESLMIVQPETVLRWRRDGWSAIWGYRSSGHWRGGRPRVSREVRALITQMARENFLWGAPRIHGELLMLGFSVSQATVSRYLPAPSRRPTQSWRTFLRNQAIAFGHHQRAEEHSDVGYLSLRVCSYRDSLMRFVAQIARLSAGFCRWHAHQTRTPTARRIALRPGRRARGAMHRDQRLNTAPARSWKARGNRLPTAVPMRSPPYEARASPRPQSRTTQDVTFRTDQVLRRHSNLRAWPCHPRNLKGIFPTTGRQRLGWSMPQYFDRRPDKHRKRLSTDAP